MTIIERLRLLLVFYLIAAGFVLSLVVFYPGLMTYDARYVYAAITDGHVGDWQSPVMTWLWAWIDPIAPGSASMFLLIATLYWLAFAVLALVLIQKSTVCGLALPVFACIPPAFVLLGVIWRDVLFANTWLLGTALTFAVADFRALHRLPALLIALVLVAFGVLLRPNALLAAPILCAYVLWPSRWYWRRLAVLYIPAVAVLFALIQLVYYDVLGAARQHPLHEIFVFDLGGISHFSKQNVFPVEFTPEQTALLTSSCYDPTMWDVYWNREPCRFVMDIIEKQEKIFGTPALFDAWKHAIFAHPRAYLEHRATYVWTFLTGENFTVWFQDLDDPSKVVFPDNAALMAVKTVHDTLKPTPLFRTGTWLLLCAFACVYALRRRQTAAGAFVLAVGGSAIVYLATFSVVGVAADFRYAYWVVLAGLASATAAALPSSGKAG